MHLTAVAQVDGPVERDSIVGEAFGRQLFAGTGHHRRVDLVDLSGRARRGQCLGHGVLVHDIGREQAEGGVHRSGVGDHDALHPKLRAEYAAKQAAGAAEGMQHEVARVEAAFDRDLVDEVGDLRRGDAVDADGGILHAHAERRRDLLGEDLPSLCRVEGDGAAEEGAGVHVAYQQHDIREGGLAAAEAVADRSGPGAGASRTHAGHAGCSIERHDAATAGADGDHLDLGRHVMIAVDHRLAGVVDGTALNHADLEGRAPMSQAMMSLVLHELSKMPAPDDARCGAALEHAHRPRGRFLGREQSAVALHDEKRSVIAPAAHQRLQAGNVLAGDAPCVSVDDRGGGTLVLAGTGAISLESVT